MRAIRWALFNSIVFVLAYLAIIRGMERAGDGLQFVCFILLVLSLTTFMTDVQNELREQGRSVPSFVNFTFDLVVTIFLLSGGFIWSGIAYFSHSIITDAAIAKALKGE